MIDYVSKMKLDRAFKKAEKEMDRARKIRMKLKVNNYVFYRELDVSKEEIRYD